MRKIRKANALLLTTMILFAVSIISTGLTMYFYRANRIIANQNLYNTKYIELSNKLNETYKLILNNDMNNPAGKNLLSEVKSLNSSTPKTTFKIDTYKYEVMYKETNLYSFSVESTYNQKTYHLERDISLASDTYSLSSREVYYVNGNR